MALRGGETALDDAKSPASHRPVPVEQMHAGTVDLFRQLRVRQASDRLALGTSYANSAGLVVVDAAGRPMRPDVYSDRFRALCAEAGVPVIRLHAVRHTTALLMHRAGVAPADVAKLLGHTVATHLDHYLEGTDDGAHSAASAYGRRWQRSAKPLAGASVRAP